MNKLNIQDFQKKLFYQSKNRGCKETGYILNKFAEQLLSKLNEKKLNDFALILDQDDNDLYNWLTNKSPTPSSLDADIMDKLRELLKE